MVFVNDICIQMHATMIIVNFFMINRKLDSVNNFRKGHVKRAINAILVINPTLIKLNKNLYVSILITEEVFAFI